MTGGGVVWGGGGRKDYSKKAWANFNICTLTAAANLKVFPLLKSRNASRKKIYLTAVQKNSFFSAIFLEVITSRIDIRINKYRDVTKLSISTNKETVVFEKQASTS
jgi:hypothetical protein